MKKNAAVIAVLTAINYIYIVDFMIVNPVAPILMRQLGVDTAQFGFIVSSYMFCSAIAGVLVSPFIDQFRRRRALLTFFSGFILLTAACGVVTTYDLFVLMRSLSGACGGVMSALVITIATEITEPRNRGAAIGSVMSAFGLAAVSGVPFALYVSSVLDIYSMFMVIAFGGLLVLFFAFALIPDIPTARTPISVGMSAINIRQFLKSSSVSSLMLTAALNFSAFLIIPFIGLFFVFNVGVREEDLFLMYFFGGLSTIFATKVIGRLSDYVGTRAVFIATGFVSIVPVLLITNLRPIPFPAAVFCSVLFFVFVSGRVVPAMSIVIAAVDHKFRAGFMSVNASVQALSAALAVTVGSYLLHRINDGTVIGYDTVGFLSAAMTLAAIYFGIKIVPIAISNKS